MQPGPRPKINPDIVERYARPSLAPTRCDSIISTAAQANMVSARSIHTDSFTEMRHYLVAWSESDRARDFRSFALSNIERVELLDKTFTRRRGFSLRVYAERSFGVFQEKPFDVVWRFTPKAAADARQFLFHPTQAFEDQPDGSLIVRFRAGGALEMCWHLFHMGRSGRGAQAEAPADHSVRTIDCHRASKQQGWQLVKAGGRWTSDTLNDQRAIVGKPNLPTVSAPGLSAMF